MSDISYGGSMSRPNLFCPNCGNATPYDATMCAQCGATLPNVPGVSTVAPTSTAGVSYGAQLTYGGFWIRFVAAFLDGLLVEIVVLPVSFALGAGVGLAGSAVSMPDMGRQIVAAIGGMAFGLVVSWLYESVMESSEKQATFGKMLLGLKVTDEAGQRISFARASGRHFAKYLSGMILLIGYIMAGFTAKKQALHDMIAGTLVIKK
jgi:uncharacterized RDD family membrane protein YckC/ribosomal protein S27AE